MLAQVVELLWESLRHPPAVFPRAPIVPVALIFNPVMFALIYISVAFE